MRYCNLEENCRGYWAIAFQCVTCCAEFFLVQANLPQGSTVPRYLALLQPQTTLYSAVCLYVTLFHTEWLLCQFLSLNASVCVTVWLEYFLSILPHTLNTEVFCQLKKENLFILTAWDFKVLGMCYNSSEELNGKPRRNRSRKRSIQNSK